VHGDRVRIAATELLFHTARASVEPSVPATMHQTTSLRLEDAVYLRSSAEVPEHAGTQRDLLALVRIGTAIARIHQRPQLESELLDAALAVTPASAAAFLRIDPETGDQTLVQSRTRAGRLEVRPSGAVVGLSLSKREALLTNVSGEDRQQAGAAAPAGCDLMSVLAVPVLDGEGVAGLLYLDTSDSKATCDRRDRVGRDEERQPRRTAGGGDRDAEAGTPSHPQNDRERRANATGVRLHRQSQLRRLDGPRHRRVGDREGARRASAP
jgi:hypothetical protein